MIFSGLIPLQLTNFGKDLLCSSWDDVSEEDGDGRRTIALGDLSDQGGLNHLFSKMNILFLTPLEDIIICSIGKHYFSLQIISLFDFFIFNDNKLLFTIHEIKYVIRGPLSHFSLEKDQDQKQIEISAPEEFYNCWQRKTLTNRQQIADKESYTHNVCMTHSTNPCIL